MYTPRLKKMDIYVEYVGINAYIDPTTENLKLHASSITPHFTGGTTPLPPHPPSPILSPLTHLLPLLFPTGGI